MKQRSLISAILLAFYILMSCQSQSEKDVAVQVDLAQVAPEQSPDQDQNLEKITQDQPNEATETA